MKRVVSLLAAAVLSMVLAFGQSSPFNVIQAIPQPPTLQPVTQIGQLGTTTYYYWVVAVYTGGKSGPAGPVVISTSNATLSSTNYNVVNFTAPTTPVATPTGYDILRTTTTTSPTGACACAVATAQAGSPINDQSNTTSAYSVATLASNYSQVFDNASAAIPQVITYINGVKTSVSLSQTNSVSGSLTDAQLATGSIIVAGVTGHTMILDGATIQPIGGAIATCTNIDFGDSAFANPKFRFLSAGTLSQNVAYSENNASTIVTVGGTTALDAAFGANLGIGLQSNGGGTCTTATGIKYRIYYRIL